MARQTYYVTREQRHPLYATRMLKAGPLELDAGAARLYRRLGVDLSAEPAAPAPTPPPRKAPTKAAPKRKRTRKAKK